MTRPEALASLRQTFSAASERYVAALAAGAEDEASVRAALHCAAIACAAAVRSLDAFADDDWAAALRALSDLASAIRSVDPEGPRAPALRLYDLAIDPAAAREAADVIDAFAAAGLRLRTGCDAER